MDGPFNDEQVTLIKRVVSEEVTFMKRV